jgi:hypothetical protein
MRPYSLAPSYALRLVRSVDKKKGGLVVQRADIPSLLHSKFTPKNLLAVDKKTWDNKWLNDTVLDSIVRAILELHRIRENEGTGEWNQRSPSIIQRVVDDIRRLKSRDVHMFVTNLVDCVQTEALHGSFHIILRNCQGFCMTVLTDSFLQRVANDIIYMPQKDDTIARYTSAISQNDLRVHDMLEWIGWHSSGQTVAELPLELGLPYPDAQTDAWFWLSAMTYCYTKVTYLAEDHELRRRRKGTQAFVIHQHLFGERTYYVPPAIALWQRVWLPIRPIVFRILLCVICWRLRFVFLVCLKIPFYCFILLLRSFGFLLRCLVSIFFLFCWLLYRGAIVSLYLLAFVLASMLV